MELEVNTIESRAYIESLNEEQKNAVLYENGPMLVLAGAGTGKTKVLVSRIAHLIIDRNISPYNILAVTFTNKAAREMTERLNQHTNINGMWIGTFHSVATKILRQNAELLNLSSQFNIIDTDDQIRQIKQILEVKNLDLKNFVPKVILNIIQYWKDLGLMAGNVTHSYIKSPIHKVALDIYPIYQSQLKQANVLDFGDLLLYNLQLFTEHPDVLQNYQERFKHLLIDEYQDTNIAQYLWIRLLASRYKNIFCVGDDDQSIYGWRGAEVGNILRFETDFPTAQVVKLEVNYRSSPKILHAASGLISNNSKRLDKTLRTNKESGEPVKLTALWNEQDEAQYIANEIIQKQIPYNNIAILVRTSYQTRMFEEFFMHNAIPYKVLGNLRFYDRMEVRDVIAYIRATRNIKDSMALERIINKPKRSIGNATLDKVIEHAHANDLSLFESIQGLLNSQAFPKRMQEILKELIHKFMTWNKEFDQKTPLDAVNLIINESGYINMLESDKSLESKGRLDNVKELLKAIGEFTSIDEFLEHVSLVTDIAGENEEYFVTIMTLHGAKGLEFDTVFLPGWEEGIFPNMRALNEKGQTGLEEERRLAYVGLTRAKHRAYISYVTKRRMYNQWLTLQPSRFIKEIPKTAVESRICYNTDLYDF